MINDGISRSAIASCVVINPPPSRSRSSSRPRTAGQFYPSPDFNPLSGFDVQGRAPQRRWTLNDSERARTDIERLVFDEDPNNSGGIPPGDYSMVNVEITVGTGSTADKLTGTANLLEKPAGSVRWRLATEP